MQAADPVTLDEAGRPTISPPPPPSSSAGGLAKDYTTGALMTTTRSAALYELFTTKRTHTTFAARLL